MQLTKRLFLLSGLIFLAIFLTGITVLKKTTPPDKKEQIMVIIGQILEQVHFSPKAIDNNFSKIIYKTFLEELDDNKDIFLASDIQRLSAYETTIDDAIHEGSLAFFNDVNDIYQKRLEEVAQYYQPILAKPFDFSVKENMDADGKKLEYCDSEKTRQNRWRLYLKYLTLERYQNLLETREKNKTKPDFVVQADTTLERIARDKVRKVVERNFDRLRKKFTPDERFSLLMNTITNTMDPHTNYFPPVEKRAFNEGMSGRFYGIGAMLREDNGYVKISSVSTGGPAWKSGEIQAGDAIINVAQSEKEPGEDVVGYSTEEAVKLIRGNEGTSVTLTLKKTDGSVKKLTLKRAELTLEETFAKSAIINGAHKIGYIDLPAFYADFERPNGARCAKDVAKEIIKLKAENVEGIILDIRDNGGGSLNDVVEMVGLFIKDGPIVQVKDRRGRPQIYEDRDRSVLYEGPLMVMVNEFSASASEIFAAAIQDYKRGIIIGSSSTYGKGTVQRPIPLDFNSDDLGSIHLTFQKYYRINGGSTQLKGVIPDLVLPGYYEDRKLREKDEPFPLTWDEQPKLPFNPWPMQFDIPELKKKQEIRQKADNRFVQISQNGKWVSKENEKQHSLELKQFSLEAQELEKKVAATRSLFQLPNSLPIVNVAADVERINSDNIRKDRNEGWLKFTKTDAYLGEAINVLNDALQQKSMVKN